MLDLLEKVQIFGGEEKLQIQRDISCIPPHYGFDNAIRQNKFELWCEKKENRESFREIICDKEKGVKN